MERDWVQYQCKSGQAMFLYNKDTGEHKLPHVVVPGTQGKSIHGHPVAYKEFSTTGTQTDDHGCSNGCTSIYANTDLSQRVKVTRPNYTNSSHISDTMQPRCVSDEANTSNDSVSADSNIILIEHEPSSAHEQPPALPAREKSNNKLLAYQHRIVIKQEARDKPGQDETFQVIAVCDEQELEHKLRNEQNDLDSSGNNYFSGNKVIDRGSSYLHQSELRNYGQNECVTSVHDYSQNTVADRDREYSGNTLTDRSLHGRDSYEVINCDDGSDDDDYNSRDIDVNDRNIPPSGNAPHDKKPFECFHCNRRFSRKFSRDRHVLIHLNLKPYKCPFCKKGFRDRGKLNSHVKMHNQSGDPEKIEDGEHEIIPAANDHVTNNLEDEEPDVKDGYDASSGYDYHGSDHDGVKSCVITLQTPTIVVQLNNGNIDQDIIDNGAIITNLHTAENHAKNSEGTTDADTTKANTEPCDSSPHDKKLFKCSHCERTFSTKFSRDRHVLIHLDLKPYECTFCKKAFRERGNLNSHMKIHIPSDLEKKKDSVHDDISLNDQIEINLRDEESNIRAMNDDGTKGYINYYNKINVSNVEAKSCVDTQNYQDIDQNIDNCAIITNVGGNSDAEYRESFGEYVNVTMVAENESLEESIQHNKKIKIKKIFECQHCEKTFSSKFSLNRHVLIHLGLKPHKCSFCNKAFRTTNKINAHLKKHHSDQIGHREDSRTEPNECPICKKQFALKSVLKTHMITHSDKKPFECFVCHKRFNYKGNLKVHAHTHTDIKPFKCSVCNKQFTRKSILQEHAKLHSTIKPFECNICQKTFTYKWNYTNHMLTVHDETKRFECDVCKKRFSQRCYLAAHSITHTGVKAFECSVCNKKFTTKSNLFLHSNIHTGIKPFECSVCKKTFTRKCSMVKHTEIHTKTEVFLNMEENT